MASTASVSVSYISCVIGNFSLSPLLLHPLSLFFFFTSACSVLSCQCMCLALLPVTSRALSHQCDIIAVPTFLGRCSDIITVLL